MQNNASERPRSSVWPDDDQYVALGRVALKKENTQRASLWLPKAHMLNSRQT